MMLPIILLCMGVFGLLFLLMWARDKNSDMGVVAALVIFIGAAFLITCGVAGIRAEANPPKRVCTCK